MSGFSAVALALAFVVRPPVADERDEEVAGAVAASDNLRDWADRRATAGDLEGAADFYLRAYDRLAFADDAPDLLDLAHEPLEKAVNVAAEAQRRAPGRTDLLCQADRRVIRHAVLLADAGRLTPAAIVALRIARARLQGRLNDASAICPRPNVGGPPSIQLHAADAYQGGFTGPVLEPGALARATMLAAVAVTPGPPRMSRAERGRLWTRAGVGLLAAGMMTISLGIVLAADERPASAALTFVAGTTGFVAGFPLLILGDRHRRADLSLGPGRVALAF